jgi:hypothetical protein
MRSKLLSEGELAAEAKAYSNWLNWVFAVLTANMAIGALQFPQPWKIALLGLVVVAPMYMFAFVSFPASLRALRALHKETQDSEVKRLLEYYEAKYFGATSIYRNAVLWLALALYVTVLLSFSSPFSAILWFGT